MRDKILALIKAGRTLDEIQTQLAISRLQLRLLISTLEIALPIEREKPKARRKTYVEPKVEERPRPNLFGSLGEYYARPDKRGSIRGLANL